MLISEVGSQEEDLGGGEILGSLGMQFVDESQKVPETTQGVM